MSTSMQSKNRTTQPQQGPCGYIPTNFKLIKVVFSLPKLVFALPYHFVKVQENPNTCFIRFQSLCLFFKENILKIAQNPIVQKLNSMYIEIVDTQPLSYGDITHEIVALKVIFGNHSSLVVLNVIRTPSNLVILGFFWLEKYYPHIDWRSHKL